MILDLNNEIRNKIKEIILNYCEGIEWKEFNINDLDKIANEIIDIEELDND